MHRVLPGFLALVFAAGGAFGAVTDSPEPLAAGDWLAQAPAATPEPDAAPVAPAPETDAAPPLEAVPASATQPMPDGSAVDLNRIELESFYEALEAAGPQESVRVSLEDCIRMALESNLDIQLLSFGPLQSDADVLAAKGEFDPVASTSATYTRSEATSSAQTVVFGGISSVELYRTVGEAAVRGKLRYGTQYDVTLSMDKEESTFNRFIEEWSGGLTLAVSQPLLRGRGSAVNLARIRIAQNSRITTENQLQLQVMSTLAEVFRAYWDLVGAIEQLNVRKESAANAERLLETNQKRFEIGTAAAIEVVQAKAGLAMRQSDLISARANVVDAQNVLRSILNVQYGEPLYGKQLVPMDRPNPEEIELDETASIDVALLRRLEVESALVGIESARLEERRASNALLPDVQVGGSVSQGGRNHKPRQVFYGIRDRDDTSYSVTLRGSVPLGNRTARGQFERARLDRRQAEHRLEKTRQDIALNVRLAMSAVETSRILVESSRQTRKLQEVNLAAEEKRLQLGLTTSYQVMYIQEDLTSAQTQEVQAMIAFEKALVDLRLAEGTLLDSLGVAFDAPDNHRPVSFFRSVIPMTPSDKKTPDLAPVASVEQPAEE